MSSAENSEKINCFTYFTVVTVSLLGFSLGIGTTWSSPIVFKLADASNDDNPLGYAISESEMTWIGSLNSLGCAIGPVPFGYLAGKVGRKPVLLIVASIFVIAYLILAFAKIVVLYYVARYMVGTAFAGVFALMPTYVSEIAGQKDRGILNAITFVMVCLGMMIPYVIGPYLPIMIFNLFCCFFPLAFFILFLIFGVETPHYLVAKNKSDKAVKALEKLRGSKSDNVQKEIQEIQAYIEANKEGSIVEVFKSKILLKAFGIALGLYTFQQFTGIVPLANYTQVIIEEAGSNLSSDIAAIIVSVVQFTVAIILLFIVSRFRFRIFLMISCAGVITFLTMFGIYFFLSKNTDVDTSSFGFVPILAMAGTISSCILGLGILPAIITSELFPTNLRALVIAICIMIASTESFLLAKFFSHLNDALGIAGTVWLFAGVTSIGFVFVYFLVPETNGKSFQEIQDAMRK